MKTETDYTKILKPDFKKPVKGYRYRNGRKFKCLAVDAAGGWPIITQDLTDGQVYRHLKDGRFSISSGDDPLNIVPYDPGFPTLKEGFKWHREDLVQQHPEDFAGDGRPLVEGELAVDGDFYYYQTEAGERCRGTLGSHSTPDHDTLYQTNRPLPDWARPEEAKPDAPNKKKKRVPLEEEDWSPKDWWVRESPGLHPAKVSEYEHSGIYFVRHGIIKHRSYLDLLSLGFKRTCDGGTTWEPCWKEVDG